MLEYYFILCINYTNPDIINMGTDIPSRVEANFEDKA